MSFFDSKVIQSCSVLTGCRKQKLWSSYYRVTTSAQFKVDLGCLQVKNTQTCAGHVDDLKTWLGRVVGPTAGTAFFV